MPARAKRVMLIGIDAMQLCQVQRFAREGALPNFSRLLAMGAAGEMLPEAPAWTPTNWGTIATGALPGSTKLQGWFRRMDERDIEGRSDISTFSSEACPTDTIWAAAERAGMSTLSIFYPLTWPARTERGMVVAPLYCGPGVAPLEISKSRVWTTRQDRIPRSDPLLVGRHGDKWVAQVDIEPSTMELAKEFNFGDKPEQAREMISAGSVRSLKVVFDPGSESAEIIDEDNVRLCGLMKGQWSEWVFLDFGARGNGSVRFHLASCDGGAQFGFTLAHSVVYPTRDFTYPADISAELVENVGPFVPFPVFLPGAEGDRLWLKECEYQGLWMARSAEHLLNTRGWDLYIQHYHPVDNAMHRWLHIADPSSGTYDPQTAEYGQSMIRGVYQAADTMLGAFMNLMDEDTALIVVSDHGCIPSKWEVDYSRMLETGGFLVRDGGGVVWEKTKAFMISQRIGDIYINTEGRFPRGSVEPSDHERVQEEIIDHLLDLRNPDGKRVVAYALKKKDAEIVGQYGPETGDVVFMLNSFHGRGDLPQGQAVRRARGSANHATMLPTTRTPFSSDLAAAIIAGPGIRSGYVRDDQSVGLWRLTDIAPTICKLLDIEPPHDSRGAVMHDLFE